MKRKPDYNIGVPTLLDYKTLAYAFLLSAGASLPLAAQPTPAAPAPAATETDPEEEVVQLSPFEVTTEENEGYTAADTLAGNRLNTQLRDIGNAVTVITSQFLKDTGAVNNETLLQYTTNTEVGNIQGNFAGVGDGARLDESSKFTNPNQNNRVRGLTEADNSRNYFVTSTPWDGYNVDRVDLQRGPNSILFGQGAPAGLINTGTKEARFRNSAEVEARIASYGSYRGTLDLNHVLLEDQLAVRLAAVYDDEKFKQKPAFEKDRRVYATARWEPAFLKQGSARTVLKANFETGSIRSNRPRSLPAMDRLTPWFLSGTTPGNYNFVPTAAGVYPFVPGNGDWVSSYAYPLPNRGTYTPYQLQEETGVANTGQQRRTIAGVANPYYQPWFANFGQSFGGPLAYFANPGSQATYFLSESRTTRGINSSGQIDGGIAIPFNRQGGIANASSFALNARLPFAGFGLWKDTHITDPSVFNSFTQLMDGPNKDEWQNFNSYQASLQQLFFNENFGFEVTLNHEEYDNGTVALLSGDRQAIYIDFMSVYSDGTPAARFGNGTANPNVGRPFISDSAQFSNRSFRTEYDNIRGTVFLKHDFERSGNSNSLLTRLLGNHTLTGLVGKDEQDKENKSWQRYGILDPAYRLFIGATDMTTESDVNLRKYRQLFTDNLFAPNPVIYLGPSLLNRGAVAGANIPRPMAEFVETNGTIRAFDSTWRHPLNPSSAGYVDPAAAWTNDFSNPPSASTQSDNPANYVGWVNVPMNITDSEAAPGNRDLLLTGYSREEGEVESIAGVWQGKLWENAIVATYGVRKDTVNGRIGSVNPNMNRPFTNSLGQLMLHNFELPEIDPEAEISETSRAYTVVAHLSEFPVLGRLMEKLPVDVTLFYNRSTNFQPLANRVDVYGVPIALPEGLTRDKGILFETKDRKYSFKVNEYYTAVTNGRSNGLGGTWFLGASQTWFGNWANRFEFNWFQDSNAGARPPAGDWELGTVNYNPAPGESAAEAAARETAAIAGWRAYQQTVDPRFYETWGINLNDPTRGLSSANPNGFSLSEDSVSQGYEFEFSAQPTSNWRVIVNASKVKATRRNIGGENLKDFVDNFQDHLNRRDAQGRIRGAGDLRIWWGDSGAPTALSEWNNAVGSEWAQRQLQENTSAPELRKWRLNLITTYNFDSGFLKGVYVGGGYRWQDKIVIGYRPVMTVEANGAQSVSFDIENPFFGPTESNFDFWIGYNRRISERYEWQVQLNVRNAFDGNDLIPITVQPDGSPAGYRIAPSQILSLSNTLRF